MPSKKRAEKPEDATPKADATPGSQPPTSSPTPSAEPAGPTTSEPSKSWSNPYWAIFTCPAKGFELGENRRFKQMVFTFAENPGAEVTAKLKEAGFVYRSAEKAWTTQATAASRELAVDLARELKGEQLGQGR